MNLSGEALSLRVKEVLLDGKWVANTNVKEQIESVDFREATTVYENLNSIAALTFHLTYYLKGVAQVFEGRPLEIKDQYSFDMPTLTHPKDWEVLKKDFLASAQIFIDCVSVMDDQLLSSCFVKEAYGSYQRNIEVLIEHSYYHLGQMMLIRKLVQKEL